MIAPVDLGRPVGPGHRCFVTAEIGPNWCVSADRERNLAELAGLVSVAAESGCDSVKVQLKSLDPVRGWYALMGQRMDGPPYDPERAPFATRGEYVRAREPDRGVLAHLDALCRESGVTWTASPWDLPSIDLLASFAPPWVKVASASITDLELLAAIAGMGVGVVLSTGMSTLEEIDRAVEALAAVPLVIAYCKSAYPLSIGDVDLECMETLRARYGCPIGYSGHEVGISISFAAAVLGACWVERHVTLDRSAWGPDHASSLEPDGVRRLVRDIRVIEGARRTGEIGVLACEAEARRRLRRAG